MRPARRSSIRGAGRRILGSPAAGGAGRQRSHIEWLFWGATLVLTWAAFPAARAEAARGADTTRSAFDRPDVAHVPHKLKLTPGERLVYDVKWSGVPAGQAVLEIKRKRDFEGAEAYHVVCEVSANSFVSVFYPVNDRTLTIIDAAGCFSRLFQMSKEEGRIKQDEYIRFEYDRDRAVYEKRRPGAFQTRTKKSVRIHGKMQDPLSCIYYLRTVGLVPGSTVRMPVHTVRRSWELAVEVLRREELTLPGFGKLGTLRIKPVVRFPGIFVRKGEMVVWVEEKTHIPVRMNVDIPVGSIAVTLSRAENSPIRESSSGKTDQKPGVPPGPGAGPHVGPDSELDRESDNRPGTAAGRDEIP